jgi:hypothetical protein
MIQTGLLEYVMRRLANVILAAAVLPALAQVPGPAAQVADPAKEPVPAGQEAAAPAPDQFVSSLKQKLSIDFTGMTTGEAAAMSRRLDAAWARYASTCYFIRQANSNLQKPKAKPELVPLAESGAAPIPESASDCLTDSLVRKVYRGVR